jgi:hypothetical protein
MTKEEKNKETYQKKLSNFLKGDKENKAKRDLFILQKRKIYEASTQGKVSNAVVKGFKFVKSPSKYLYSKNQLSQSTIKAIGGVKRKRGRPYGTMKYYDPQTGQPIGVYEYRKILASRLRENRLKQLRNASLNPRQREVLRQVELRDRARSMNKENQTIPDTDGNINFSDVFNDINNAVNLVD